MRQLISVLLGLVISFVSCATPAFAFSHAYLVATPNQEDSYVQFYNDPGAYAYFKFGDTNNPDENGIRAGYSTHNPIVLVAATMENQLNNGNIGTRITQDIQNSGCVDRIQGLEWFESGDYNKVWELVDNVFREWDNRQINDNNYNNFREDVIDSICQ